jgi:hypothetical protein
MNRCQKMAQSRAQVPFDIDHYPMRLTWEEGDDLVFESDSEVE